MNFICDKCGLCCQSLNKLKIESKLNDATGTCIHFDKKTKLCKIYNHRPPQCNVDYMYENYFSKIMTIDKYYEINYKVCKLLKERMF